jgi:2-polyprenyl-3-methyl-5-hydroxy-6-metoxy-1,4-benzoquinol methylase
MKAFWNERYQTEEYVYGTEPNRYFQQQLDQLPPGKILLPAEGEGRNAVYAATQGWEVTAFDQSDAGKNKAEALAQSQGVSIEYLVGEFAEHQFAAGAFDAVGLVFAHFPPPQKTTYLQSLIPLLKPGGRVIAELFSKNHLALRQQNPRVGGPPVAKLLYSTAEMQEIFAELEIVELLETEVDLSEGAFHVGRGSVVRFVGRKR